MIEPNPYIKETELVNSPHSPLGTMGGYLEDKEGQMCLRRGDRVELVKKDLYRITRTWVKPFGKPFDREFYNELVYRRDD